MAADFARTMALGIPVAGLRGEDEVQQATVEVRRNQFARCRGRSTPPTRAGAVRHDRAELARGPRYDIRR
jgi:hypothetical protein